MFVSSENDIKKEINFLNFKNVPPKNIMDNKKIL